MQHLNTILYSILIKYVIKKSYNNIRLKSVFKLKSLKIHNLFVYSIYLISSNHIIQLIKLN